MTTFATNAAWVYRLTLTPVPALPGQHSMAITSQYLGAKRPDETVVQFQAIVSDADIKALAEQFSTYGSAA